MQVSDARALGNALLAAAAKAESAGESEIALNDVLSAAAHAKVDDVQALADKLRAEQAGGESAP